MKRKSENYKNYLLFEHHCINLHREKYNEITFHWSNIPEELLYESGFLQNNLLTFKTLREKRLEDKKECKINSIQEYGLDGLSYKKNIDTDTETKIFNGLQMKLWNEKTKLTASDLGTFCQVLYMRLKKKNYESKGYLYYTCNLEKNVKQDYSNNSDIELIYLKNPYENEHAIENNQLESNIELRDYQINGISKLNEDWTGIKLLNLPCGTGKTIIFSSHVKYKQYKNILILTPLRIQAKQNLDRVKQFLPNYTSLLIDSDKEGIRDFEKIRELMNNNEKNLFSATFKSGIDIFSQIFNNEHEFDLSNTILIVDEAHNLINNDKLIKVVKSFPKVLLVTATPPSIMEEIMEYEIIFKYNIKQAIENKYICDYKIYLPLIEINNNQNIIDIEIPENLYDLDNDLCKKGLFIINGLLKTGSRKCIVYLSSIEECYIFNNVINMIFEKYHGLPYWVNIISSEQNSIKRNEILQNFIKDEVRNDTIKFLLSIRILDECYDEKKCDSVFITKLGDYSSDIKLIQRICRANRIDINNPNKIANAFIWCEDINKNLSLLQMLKDNDVEFNKKIVFINGNYDNNDSKIIIEKFNNKNKEFIDYINLKCLSIEDIWSIKKNLLFDYCNEYNSLPVQKKKYKNYDIGSWFQSQKLNIKNKEDEKYKILSENNIVKKSIDDYFDFKELNKDKKNLNFEEWKNLLFEFCNINKRKPKHNEVFKEHNIGMWLNNIKKKIDNNDNKIYKILSENEIIKNALDKSLLHNKWHHLNYENWKDLLFDYCNENNSLPVQKKKYKNYDIASWLQWQKINIKNKEDEKYKILSQNKIVKKSLDDYFDFKELNKDKIILNFEEWKNLLFEYCDINKHIPKHNDVYKEHNIGMWLNNIKKKIDNNDNEIYKILSENEIIKKNIDKFIQYKNLNFKNKNTQNTKIINKLKYEQWKDLLFEYCNENNSTPIQKKKYKNYDIGSWFQWQKLKIKDKEDEKYNILSHNKIIKKSLDDYFDFKELNKDKKTLNFEEWKDILFEFCNIYKNIPKYNDVFKEHNIGMWFNNIKKKIIFKENKIYESLSENDIIKNHLDIFIQRKNIFLNNKKTHEEYEDNKIDTKNLNLTYEQWKELLFEYCNENNSTPIQKKKYKNYDIGSWFQWQKLKIKDKEDEKYNILSHNKIIKKSLDDYFDFKELNKDKKKLNFEEWKDLLFEFCNIYKHIPKYNEVFKKYNIGIWFNNIKNKIDNTIYKILSINEIVKKNLDIFIEHKNLNIKIIDNDIIDNDIIDKKTLFFEKRKDLLFDYCNENNSIPIQKKKYKNYDIGSWFQLQKSKIKDKEDEKYKILSQNKIVKKSIDDYFDFKELNKDKKKLNFEEWKDLLFEFCNIYKHIPKYNEVFKDYKIGCWFNNIKKKINNKDNNIYNILSENEFVYKSIITIIK